MVLDLHKACGYDFNDAGTENGNPLFSSPHLQELFLSLWNEVSSRFGGKKNVATAAYIPSAMGSTIAMIKKIIITAEIIFFVFLL